MDVARDMSRAVEELACDRLIVDRGVEPDVHEPISPEALWGGEDNQLARAKHLLVN